MTWTPTRGGLLREAPPLQFQPVLESQERLAGDAPGCRSPCAPIRIRASLVMRRSRQTFATMEAHETECTSPSPTTTASCFQRNDFMGRPSTTTWSGAEASRRNARFMAHAVATRMFARSISRTEAAPKATARARSKITPASSSRALASRSLESVAPSTTVPSTKITAAATTGPASGPRPTSSTPATPERPRLQNRLS